ncbi:MAG: c-type cytochrome [Betaproteobacteria bacterium]
MINRPFKHSGLLLGATAGLLITSFTGSAMAIDAVAAKALARKESCLRCHAIEKKKEGPSYHAIAYKFKGQEDAQDKLVAHITSGEKVKLSDGHMENHRITKTKDEAQVKNLIAWILMQ